MRRSRRHMSWSVYVALAAVFLLSSQAFAAVSFSNVAGGRVANWSWDNGDPAITSPSDGSINTILVSDTLDGLCFGTNSGKGQVGVFASRIGSPTATSWGAPVKLNGAY